MAISRMNMERQMRNMGGIMGLEDQRQGYFLGKLVKKITKPIKKIVKSPIGKMALAAAALKFGGPMLGKAFPLDQLLNLMWKYNFPLYPKSPMTLHSWEGEVQNHEMEGGEEYEEAWKQGH